MRETKTFLEEVRKTILHHGPNGYSKYNQMSARDYTVYFTFSFVDESSQLKGRMYK